VGSAVYRARAGYAAVKSAICRDAAGQIPVRAAVGQAGAEVRGELAWRAHGWVSGLTSPPLLRLMRWRLAGVPRRLTVVVVLDRYGFACSWRFVLFPVLMQGRLVAVIESVGTASGHAVRVTAEAGVATFHQIPPGP
jgi:hypothetical protein